MAKASFSFPDPVTVEIPRRAKCAPPNVFKAESTCLISRVIELDACYPAKCIFAKKQQIVSGDDGRSSHYSGKFRPFILPIVSGRPNRRTSSKKWNIGDNALPVNHTHAHGGDTSQSDASSRTSVDTQHTISTAEAGDCPSDEEMADGIMFWFPDDDSPALKRRQERRGDSTSIPITGRPRVLRSQHDAVKTPLGMQ